MSRTVDERVVSMQFDNKHFESNVRTSMSTLEKLKQSLNLSGAAKGLESVNSAAKGINMSGVANAVDTVKLKFSALEVMAVTALANITNSAVNAGKRLVSAFTIDPILSGFSEYETQINAVQTILANTQSKGTTLDQVNNALDELNHYADMTIYNFTEMTRNIGTFTAAGVDLDTSVQAIKGIANLAAVSGSNSQQASTAMYQLSQALASGTVKLMDWNSVVNAGMGGQVFQDALKETARVHGISIDEMIEKEGSFRETLSQGWLSSEILTETLAKFTGDLTEEQLKSMGYTKEQIVEIQKLGKTANDAATKVKTFTQLMDTLKEAAQSGWTQTWEILVGDFEEAKELWTSVSDTFSEIINSSAEARNNMLEGWAKGGGRTMAIDALKNSFKALVSVVKPIREAFREIFPRTTSEQLLKITENIRDFTAKLILSEKAQARLKSTFKGLFAVIDIGVTIIKAVVSGIARLIGSIAGLGGGVLKVTGSIGDWISGIRDSIKESDIFGRAVGKLVDILQNVINKIKEFGSALKDKFAAPGFEKFVEILSKLWDIIKMIGSKIIGVVGSIARGIGEAFRNGDIGGVMDIINGGLIAGILLKIKQLLGGFGSPLKELANVADSIKGILSSVKDCFKAWQDELQSKKLINIAKAIAILAVSILIIASIDPSKLSSSLGAITVLFADLMASMAVFDKLGGQYKGALKAAPLMIGMAAAILILAGALKKIAEIDGDDMVKGVAGIAALSAVVVAMAKVMSKNSTHIAKGAVQIVIFAAAVKILASACKDLSSLSWEELGKGLAGVVGLMTMVALFLNTAKFSAKAMLTATGIVILAAAIKILASACQDFANMEWGGIGKGLASIGAILAGLVVFTKLMGNAKRIVSIGITLVLISASMKIFASAVKDFASMSWSEIGRGLTAFAGALVAVAIALRMMPKNVFGIGAGLVVVSAALTIIGAVIRKLGSMSWEQVAKGLVSLGGSLLILAVGLHAMKGTLAGSAALVVAAAALAVLTPALLVLGHMSWGSIAKGLLTIAGVFMVLGVAGAALGPMVPVILGLAGALALLGIGAVAIGAGLMLIAAGITALSLALSVGATAIAAGIAVIINGILSLIPAIVKAIGEAIIAFCTVIAESASAIGKAIIALVDMLIDVIMSCTPRIADGALKLIVAVLAALVKYTPQIIDLLTQFLVGIIDGLARNIPTLITAVVNLIGALFKGVIDALKGLDFKTILKTTTAVGLLTAMMAALGAITPLIPGAMAGVLGMGVVVAELAAVLAVIGGLAQIPGLQWLVSEGGNFLQKIGTAIGQFLGGIAGGFAQGMSAALPQIGADLAAFMTNAMPFIQGVKMVDAAALEGAHALVDVILALTGTSILERLTSWITGGSSLTSFGEEISEFAPHIKSYADTVKGIDTAAVEASVNAAKCLSELANNLPNSGGLAGWFAGENDIGTFGEQLIPFGKGMKTYSETIAGFNAEAVVASANAAKAIAEMTQCIPNQGGIVAWFTGDNSVANFASDLVKLGNGLSAYSQAILGFNAEAVVASANAAKALAEMTQCIPNEGGMVAWFTGENSIANFSFDLVKLGNGLSAYSLAISGFNADAVMASASAARALAEMTQYIPNEGGIIAWFTGENSVANFAYQLPALGYGLLGFSNSVTGINIENVLAATSAAKALAEMASIIPNEGGMVAWFTGENSVASFGYQLPILGQGLLGFSNSVSGINTENVIAASNAAKSLAEMTQYVPNEGGVKAWFVGESGLSRFSNEMVLLGQGLLGFSNAVSGINPENVVAAGNAAKSLAEMTQYIPNEGGIKSWFSGESGLVKFSGNLPLLGGGLLGFSNSIAGINAENITAAANAAKALAEMTQYIPNEGGIKAWFSGKSGVATFAENLPTLGAAMKGFSDSLAGISPENVAAAASAARDLAQMTTIVPEDSSRLVSFGNNLDKFAKRLGVYFSEVSKINAETMSTSTKAAQAVATFASTIKADSVKSASDALADMIKAIKQCASVKSATTSGFVSAVKNLGKVQVNNLLQTFKDGNSKMEQAGKELIAKFIDGLKAKSGAIKDTGKKLTSDCADAISDNSSAFKTAGENVVDGFADGISDNTFKAEAKAKAMAEAALKAAKEALDENSPSKEFYRIGDYAGIGFVNAFADNMSVSYKAGSGIASTAIDGLRSAISQVGDAVNSDIDTQPTIRPVLDLSDVKAGAGSISSLFGMRPSVGVMSNLGRISSMMNDNQNGTNDDIISAIRELGNKIDDVSGDTYTINGITYDDGSGISEAVKSIVRAARVERRM